MYNFTVFYTCRYIYLFIFFIIINCDMSHVLEINYLILSYTNVHFPAKLQEKITHLVFIPQTRQDHFPKLRTLEFAPYSLICNYDKN